MAKDSQSRKPDPEDAATRVRQSAEAEATRPAKHEMGGGIKSDSSQAEAAHELRQPGLSKGRPGGGKDQPSNAGNDGP